MADGVRLARRTEAPADRIVFLGHATVLIELDGMRLLTDPLLRARVVHLRRQTPPVEVDVFAAIDAVLISHLHHDHLDFASLRMLGEETAVIVPAGAGAWLGRRGFTKVTELRAGDATNVGSVELTAVPARHDGRRPGAPNAEAVGYVLRGTHTVYFAGDTELFAGMSKLAGSLDLALLPVAGWGPTLGPGHMNPREAARAVTLLRPHLVVPIHWGTLLPIGLARRHRTRLGDPPRQFAAHVAELASDVEVRVLQPGQGIEL